MNAPTPQQLREGALADLIDTLAEADAILEALDGNQRVGPLVAWLAEELARARERLEKPLRRLRLALPTLAERTRKR